MKPAVMDSLLSADRLRQRFRRRVVLNDISFSLPAGSVTGLIGENGAGKTTLLRILLGLLEATGGRAQVFGLPLPGRGVAVRRRVGYMPDSYRFDDNLVFSRICRRVAPLYPTWDAAYARELGERFDLPADTLIKTWSRGMQARLMLILALAHRPKLLLLDEPFSGLDPLVRDDILRLLGDYCAGCGATVLVSSHQMSDLERFADRVLFLHREHIILDGAVETIKAERCELAAIFPAGIPDRVDTAEAQEVARDGRALTVYCRGNADPLGALLRAQGATVERTALDLEAIFRREAAR